MANTLVTTVNVPVYGNDDKYPLNLIDRRSFGRWAIHADQLLSAHSKLAKEKLLPRDSITADINRPGTPKNGNDGCLFQVPKH
jgi:hypothetical protein